MRLVYVNADPGIAIGGSKGGSVHIIEMLGAFKQIGTQVHVLSARVDQIPDALDQSEVESVSPVRNRASPGLDRHAKELLYLSNADAICDRLIELHKSQPFDVIFERYSLWSDAGVRAARELGVPCIFEVNAPLVDEQRLHRRLVNEQAARMIEQSIIDNADHLLVVSDELLERMGRAGASRIRMSVLGNGVDLDRFNSRQLALSPGPDRLPLTVGFTGSLKNWHGIRELMVAFSLVRQQVPSAKLLIVGDGPKRQWLEGFSEGAGLSEAVEVTGWVTHDHLPELLARMDVAVAPYPNDVGHYFSPLKLFEYLAMGRPVVASRIGQTARLLRHGHSALLAKPGCPQALADGILQIHRSPSLANRLSSGGLELANQHTWTRNAKVVTRLARQLINARVSA